MFRRLLEIKIGYLLGTKVSNRLLYGPFILGVRHISRGGFFVCFWGNFRKICFLKPFLLSV